MGEGKESVALVYTLTTRAVAAAVTTLTPLTGTIAVRGVLASRVVLLSRGLLVVA